MWRPLVPLLVGLGSGSRVLQSGKAHAHAGRQSSVAHLLLDIDQSVRTAQGDAEMVFASLFAYDHQLEQSLAREMSSMNATLAKLASVRSSYLASVAASKEQIQRLGASAHSSEQNASLLQVATAKTGGQLQSLMSSTSSLLRVLKTADVTPEGVLVLPGAPANLNAPAKVYGALRELLAAHGALRPHFSDVFAAFEQRKLAAAARMTPALLKRVQLTLAAAEARLDSQRQRSLLDLAAQQQGLAAETTAVQAKEAQQQGMQAETEHAIEELSYNVAFTEAVWKMDKDLRAKVDDSMKSKADMVERIRLSRQSQLNTLKDLVELLNVNRADDEEGAAPGSLSFLEVKSKKEYPKDNLLFEIETALHHKADTHGILVRIKGMLAEAAAVDATSAVSVVKELGSVLQTLDNDQARATAAKQRCEEQKSHTVREEQDLHANLALMTSVQKHTQAAMEAARSNIKRIAEKAQALQTSAKTLSHVVSHAMKMLRGHSNDRATIMAAVERAGGVFRQSQADQRPAIALLGRMHKELEVQEGWERTYREQESSLNAAFLEYVRNYMEMLQERRGHYERSLSALELYSSEVEGDVAAQSGALRTSGELEGESQDLCDGILKFYDSFHQRRLKLIDTIKDLLPRMPELVRGAATES